MDGLTTLRLELGINAQKMIQMVQVNNKHIEDEISKGIQMALDEILKDDNFALAVKEQTKIALNEVVNKAVLGYEVRNSITKMVEEQIGKKVGEYAEKLAENITQHLK